MDLRLAEAMRSLVGVSCRRSLHANSLMLRFDFRERERGRAYLWMDPLWMMFRDGKYVTGSADWPVWDGVAAPEVNRPLWDAWCALFNPLNDTALTDFEVSEPLPHLRLRFASGHEIGALGDASDDCWWYYRDRVTGEVFEAGGRGVAYEQGEPAED